MLRCHKNIQLTTGLGSDAVDRVVRVALGTDTAADGNGGRLALDGLAVGVDVSDLELDRGVVLGGDQPVCESVFLLPAPILGRDSLRRRGSLLFHLRDVSHPRLRLSTTDLRHLKAVPVTPFA